MSFKENCFPSLLFDPKSYLCFFSHLGPLYQLYQLCSSWQYFVKNWKRFLDVCEVLLNTYLVKPGDLLSILNSVNNDIKFSMELNEKKLPFLDIIITRSGKKIWMSIYSKPTDSKHYVSYLFNCPKPYLNPIQNGGGCKKAPLTSFSPLNSPQNFLTFSFNPFATLM